MRHRRFPAGFAAAPILAAAALALAGCGDVSLYTAFGAEDAPPVKLVPDGGRLLAGTTLVLEAAGGTNPYQFSLAAGSGSLLSEDASVTYTAPESFSGELLSAQVRVMDFLGKTAQAGITVYKPLVVAPKSFTVEQGQSRTLTVTGGVPPYEVVATGGAVVAVDTTTWQYTAPDVPGTYAIYVADDEGTGRGLAVTVVGLDELLIDPPSVLLYIGGTASFQVRGGTLDYDFSVLGPGSIDTATGTSDPTEVTYTAPQSAGGAGLQVTDAAGTTVTAALTVIDILSATYNGDPESNKIKIFDNQTIVVVVSGGLAPYSFAVEPDPGAASQGSVAAGASDTATYTPPVVSAKQWETIKVEDDAGSTLFQLVEIKPAQ